MPNLVDVNDVYALFGPNGTAHLHVADIDRLPRVKYEAPRAKWKWVILAKALVAVVILHSIVCGILTTIKDFVESAVQKWNWR